MKFPKEWDIWHSDNHWSNENTTKHYIEKIIVPFVCQKRKSLKLQGNEPALHYSIRLKDKRLLKFFLY